MDNSKQAQLPKVILNVTVDKSIGDIEVPIAAKIDITDILDEKGVHFATQINGVSEEPKKEGPIFSRFVVDEQELSRLAADINGIIDAAIVNEKQGKAIRNLIASRFDTFKFKRWEQIRNGDFL